MSAPTLSASSSTSVTATASATARTISSLLSDLVDLCANIVGIQLDIGDCDGIGGSPGPVDVCLNLPGVQVNIGDCPNGPGTDVCPNLPGVQTNPAQCPGGGGDVCPNLPGVQTNPAQCPGTGGPGAGGAGGAGGGANAGAQACFFSQPNFAGQSFCLAVGQSLAEAPIQVISIEISPGVIVTICQRANPNSCETVAVSVPQLFGSWLNGIGRIQVAAGTR